MASAATATLMDAITVAVTATVGSCSGNCSLQQRNNGKCYFLPNLNCYLLKYRSTFTYEPLYSSEIETARVSFLGCKQSRTDPIFAPEAQSGTLQDFFGNENIYESISIAQLAM